MTGLLIRMLPSLIVLSVFLVFLNWQMKKSRYRLSLLHIAGVLLFAAAMAVVFGMTGIAGTGSFGTSSRLEEVNLIPFVGMVKMLTDAIREQSYGSAAVNIIGNIAMFVPLGFMLPLLWKAFRKPLKTISGGFLISLLIETSQLFSRRCSDVDDLILNTLGAAVGYGIFYVFSKLTGKFSERFTVWNVEGRAAAKALQLAPYACVAAVYAGTLCCRIL